MTSTKNTSKKPSVAVIGSGSWATAIVKILTYNNCNVYWWIRRKEILDYVREHMHNPNYISSFEAHIPPSNLSNKIKDVVEKADTIIFAVPSNFLIPSIVPLTAENLKNKTIVSAIKGLAGKENLTVSQFFQTKYNIPTHQSAIVTGPCHAEEVAGEKLSFLTIASENDECALNVQKLFECKFIKTSITQDVSGCEFAAVLKNVYALCSGICNGLGYGDNYQAVFMCHAMQEMEVFLNKINNKNRILFNTAYLGDLLVTAYSQYSRNRTFGNMIGKGYSVKFAQMEMNMIAEGYFAVKALNELRTAMKIEMPILEAAYKILYDNAMPGPEIRLLEKKMKA